MRDCVLKTQVTDGWPGELVQFAIATHHSPFT